MIELALFSIASALWYTHFIKQKGWPGVFSGLMFGATTGAVIGLFLFK